MDPLPPSSGSSGGSPWLLRSSGRKWRQGCFVTVILSSAVLGGILFYFTRTDQRATLQISRGLAAAVLDYEKARGRLPLPPNAPAGDGGDLQTDTTPAGGWAAILMGRSTAAGENTDSGTPAEDFLNRHAIPPAKSTPGALIPWVKGRVEDPSAGLFSVVDAWGNPFRVKLDTSGDGRLAHPDPGRAAAGTPALTQRVLVWSAGKDGDWDTWKDNLASWE